MTDKWQELKRLAEACTALDLQGAQERRSEEDDSAECPACGGEGYLPLEATYTNFDNRAIGVQFFGIGNEFGAADAYLRAANPAAILELLAELQQLRERVPVEAIHEGIEAIRFAKSIGWHRDNDAEVLSTLTTFLSQLGARANRLPKL